MSTNQSKKRPANKGSLLLTAEENEVLFSNLRRRNCNTLASGVVQLLAAEPPKRKEWKEKLAGIVCFIKDYTERGYFIRIYDINKTNPLLWEQCVCDGFVLHQNTDVNAPDLSLVTFERDDCVYGLKFSSTIEANEFVTQVRRLSEKRQEQRSSSRLESYNVSGYSQLSNAIKTTSVTDRNIIAPSLNIDFSNGTNNSQMKKKGKPTKEDICLPANYEHRAHAGWDPKGKFQSHAVSGENLDPQIQQLLEKIGMPANKKQTKKDLDMIYDIIDQHGGMQQLEHKLNNPPLPLLRPSPHAPIVTSSLSYSRNERTLEPKVRDFPQIPPTSVSNNSRPVQQPSSSKPVPPPRSRNGPLPPPSRLPSSAPAPPTLSGEQSNLLSEIPQGVQDRAEQRNESMHTSHSADSHDIPQPLKPSDERRKLSPLFITLEVPQGVQLRVVQSNERMHTSGPYDTTLNVIKEGISLRPVDKQERQCIVPSEELGGIATAQLKAMAATADSNEDANDENDDNEWDD